MRRKSSEDLHKLWYVLLKERNMLSTMKLEARRLQSQLPAADRQRKVRKGMGAIKQVIGERDRAIKEYRRELCAQKPEDIWAKVKQVVITRIHSDVEEEEFVELLEKHSIDPLRFELLISRHERWGRAVLEMKEPGQGSLVREKLHNVPFIDGMKLRVDIDKEVAQYGLLSERPEPSEMIMRARILRYKQFPADVDPLRPKNKFKRKDEIEAAFERLEAEERGEGDVSQEK